MTLQIAATETCAPPQCKLCHANVMRYPYRVKFVKLPEPMVICKSCYRTIMCLDALRLYGGLVDD